MKIRMLGGCQIGASSAEITFFDGEGKLRRMIFDSGVDPRTRKPPLNLGGPVDIVAASHAHDDHIGNIPFLFYENSQTELWMSRPTTFLAKMNWLVSDRKMHQNSRLHPELRGTSNQFSEGLYNAGQNLRIIESGGRYEVFPEVFSTFGSSGHLIGAMWMALEAEGKIILISGDMSFQDRPTVKGAILGEFPKKKIDAFFMDSTSGGQDMPNLKKEAERLASDISRSVSEGRTNLIPALTLGRLPDVVIFLAEKGIDTFVDGQGIDSLEETLGPDGSWDHTTNIPYIEGKDEEGFRFFKIGSGKIRLIENNFQRRKMLERSGGKTITAPSGMLVGGRSVQYAGRYLSDPEARVYLTSYQAEGTPGWDLKKKIVTGGDLELEDADGKKFKVAIRAKIGDYNWSSHASAPELVEMVRYLNPDKTFLVHGEDKSREALKAKLAETSYCNVFIPQNGEEIEI